MKAKAYILTDEEVEALLDIVRGNEVDEEEINESLNENDPFVRMNRDVIINFIRTLATIMGNNIYESESSDVKVFLNQSDLDRILDALEELKGEIEWILHLIQKNLIVL